MGGPRIIVFHIRQLLKTGIFVLIGLIIIILLIWVLVPKDKNDGIERMQSTLTASSALYNPGTYNSQILLQNKAIDVSVTVSDSKITDILLSNMEEAQEAMYPLLKPTMEALSKDIIKYQTTSVSAGENAEVTGQVLLEAINAALSQAYAKTVDTGIE